MFEYLAIKQAFEGESVRFGLEVDCDRRGNLILSRGDRRHFDCLFGAIHSLPVLTKDAPPTRQDHEDFLFLVEKLLTAGLDGLVHPFRIFRRSGWEPPPELFEPVATLLRRRHAAAEINFHTNEPPVEFIRTCLDSGVKFSFGSDAHHLAEIGDFACHLALLKQAGFNGDPSDILVSRG